MTRHAMTTKPERNEVSLSIRDLLAIASGVFAIIGTTWAFSNRVESSIAVLGERMVHVVSRIEALERDRDRRFLGRDSPISKDQPTP
jgi:hypothetical protein